MPSENIEAAYAWLRKAGFMTSKEETADELVAKCGYEDGVAVGTWVVDGNTSDETCRTILQQMADCEWDGPELRLGEWADGPTFDDILDDLGIDHDFTGEVQDDLWSVYSDAWYDGLHAEVERACRARVTPDVTQTAATSDE